MGNKKTKDLPLPEYLKIRRYAMNRLFHLKSGDDLRMPSLQEMMQMFGVSRPTVRKALKDLVKDGYLVAKPGIGMFVNPKYLNENTDLRSSRPVVGILMGDGMLVHLEPYFAQILARFLLAAAKNPAIAHQLQLPGIPEDKICDYIKSEQLDSLVWIHPDPKYAQVIRQLRDSEFPVAVLNAGNSAVEADVSFDMRSLGHEIGKILVREKRTNVVYLGRKTVENVPFEEIRSVFEKNGLSCDNLHFIEVNSGAKKKLADLLKKEKADAVVNAFLPYECLTDIIQTAGTDLKKQCLLIQNGIELSEKTVSDGIIYDFPVREAAEELLSRVISEEKKEKIRLPFRLTRFQDGCVVPI